MARKRQPVRPAEKVIEKIQQTTTGIYVNAGEIDHSDYDLKNWQELQADYTKMRNSDALLSTTVDILKYPVLMSNHRIETLNKDVEEYVNWVFDRLYKGFQYLKYHKLLALDFGLSMHEIVVERGLRWKGKLTNAPIWLNPIQNETINKFHYNDQLIFTGIEHEKQVPDKGSSLIDIPAENLHWFTLGEEYNDIRGRSIYRTVRFFWESKHKLITSKVTGAQRAVGIPVLYSKGEPSSSDRRNIETIGRTIAMMRDGYVSMNEEKLRLQLESPKGQEDIIPMLDYLDRQMFFNTMSQFMTAGIGQNGSRAATGELKSPYEIYATYIMHELELNMQSLVDRIIDMSCYAGISDEEWPIYKQDSVKTTDLVKAAGYIKNLVEAGGLSLTPEDEVFIRQMFGFPEKAQAAVTVTIPENVEQNPEIGSVQAQLSKPHSHRKMSAELQEFESRVFSKESAAEHFLTMTDKTAAALDDIAKKYFGDIAYQLKSNRHREIRIRGEVIEYAMEKLTALYESGFQRGVRDVKSELAKIKKSMSLAEDRIIKPTKQLKLEKTLKRFFFNAKTVIENKMDDVSDAYIENAGGLDNVIMGYSGKFKQEKNNVAAMIEQSYTSGRGATLLEFKDQIQTYLYTAVLDEKLCENCGPYDGLIFTFDEVGEQGLNIGEKGVNPNCLGSIMNCRCQLMAYEIKSGVGDAA